MVLASVVPARAQIYESVGIRAQGMAGAFVAVADDASATWWNPAGLAGGAYFNTILEYNVAQNPKKALDAVGLPVPAWRSGVRGFAAAFPALGLSYYQLRVSEIQSLGPTDAAGLVREDQRRAPVLLSSLVLQQFGATVGQSVGNHLVLGATLKLARGRFALATTDLADASLDGAERLNGPVDTHGDLDLGAMAAFGTVRIGLAVKNVTEPTFQSGTAHVTVPRQARVGVAATSAGGGGRVTIAADGDLTRTSTPAGDERHAAVGLELMFRRRIGLRGGVAVNTVGDLRPVGSGGLSFALRSRLFLDAQATGGADQARRSWGAALRVTY